MNYRIYILFFSLWIGLIFYFEKPNTIKPKKHPKEEMQQAYYDLEWKKTHDLKTGEIPKERLLIALEETEKFRANNLLFRSEFGIPNMDWEERGPNNIGGRARAAIFDASDPSGNTVWAGAVGGGLWKTTNFLSTNYQWTLVNPKWESMAITALCQSKTNPSILFAGTGEGWGNSDAIRGLGIWRSTDGGNTWNRLQSTATGDYYYVSRIESDNNGNIFAATKTGIFRSIDQGNTWVKVFSENITDFEIASNGMYYFAAKGLGIYKSSTGLSASWTRFGAINYVGVGRIELAVSPSNPNYIYALLADATTSGCKSIVVTKNGGDTWESKTPPAASGMSNFCRNQAWYDLTVGVDLYNPAIVYIGGVDCLKSIDEGNTWTQISNWSGSTRYMHADQHLILMHPTNSNLVLFANDGGIFLTTSAQSAIPNIENRVNGFNATQYYAGAIHPKAGVDSMLAGAQDNGSQLFYLPSLAGARKVTGGDGAYCHIDQDEPWIQITSYVYNSYYITKNSWGSYSNISSGSSAGSFINPTDYDDKNNILYCSYNAGKLGRILNVGRAGQVYDTLSLAALGTTSEISAIKVSPNFDNRIFVGLYSGLTFLIDNANTSNPIVTRLGTGSGTVSSIDVEIGNDSHLLVTCSNYGSVNVRESLNSGLTWTSLDGNLPDMPVRGGIFAPNNPKQAFLATEVGVWTTANLNGTSTMWSPADSGMPNTRVDMVVGRISDNLVMAATHGRGVFTVFARRIPSDFKLLDFTAVDKYSHVQLDWNTTIEKGAKHFEIEKSIDGVNFEKIGTTLAKYVPNGGSYRFDDPLYIADVHYYRLKLVDTYNEFTYSPIREVRFRKLTSDVNIFPSLVKENISLQTKNYVLYNAIIRGFDMGGKLIFEYKLENGRGPNTLFEFNLSNLPSGQYVCQLWNDNVKKTTWRFIKS